MLKVLDKRRLIEKRASRNGFPKDRIGNSVRLSTDGGGGFLSKSLAYNVGACGNQNGNFVGNKFVESSSNSSIIQQQDGSHIDLALVYANFLNQQTETKPSGSFEMPELPEFDPSMEFSSNVSTNLETRVPLPEENNGLVGSLSFSDLSVSAAEAHLIRNSDQIYYHVFDKHNIQETGNHIQELPPLPCDQEILWLNSQTMMNQTLHTAAATQEPILGPDQAQDPSNLLLGNWSPFDSQVIMIPSPRLEKLM